MPENNVQLEAWLRLTFIPGLGGVGQRKLLTAFGLPEAVFCASYSCLRSAVGDVLAARIQQPGAEIERNVQAALQWTSLANNSLLTLADQAYPRSLLDLPDPPTLLYAKGDTSLLQLPACAIVGSRNASEQGAIDARQFATSLSRAGWVIVSGMALGIDANAHQGALLAGGKTIAVIGTGADRIYPARNKPLAERIVKEGLLISEFPLGTPPQAPNFPRRNRLIAGLSRGVLVVEAANESGSLITARLAVEQGKEVFAVPGSIHSPLARGCHALIRQGAKLVERTEDILEELGAPQPVTAPVIQGVDTAATATEHPLLDKLGYSPVGFDALLERSGFTPDVLNATLFELELSGFIQCLPGGRYQRLVR